MLGTDHRDADEAAIPDSSSFWGLEQAFIWGGGGGFTLYKTGMIFIFIITMTTT